MRSNSSKKKKKKKELRMYGIGSTLKGVRVDHPEAGGRPTHKPRSASSPISPSNDSGTCKNNHHPKTVRRHDQRHEYRNCCRLRGHNVTADDTNTTAIYLVAIFSCGRR